VQLAFNCDDEVARETFTKIANDRSCSVCSCVGVQFWPHVTKHDEIRQVLHNNFIYSLIALVYNAGCPLVPVTELLVHLQQRRRRIRKMLVLHMSYA